MIATMQRLVRLFFAVRYMKAVQPPARAWKLTQHKVLHRLPFYRARYLRSASGSETVTPLPHIRSVHYPENEMDAHSVDELAVNRFTFLNRTTDLGSPVSWLPDGEAQLWKYNLHYFHYAVTLGNAYRHSGDTEAYAVFRRLASDWIETCAFATPIAWDAHPTSLRLTNWIKAYTLFEPELVNDESFATRLKRSIIVQAAYLETHVEYYLLGNHLIENGRALLLAGLFVTDPTQRRRALRWRRKGEKILWRELEEQYLADGGHFERSPMYHHLYLNLYREMLDLLRVMNLPVPSILPGRLADMNDWLATVLHPDGNIPLLNDAVLNMVLEAPKLAEPSAAPADGLTSLSDTGYYVFRDEKAGSFLVFDCAPLGPDYFPGHGHCDTLSYELSVDGRRLIVDSGVGNYDRDLTERLYYRSTRAHNTVVVDGAEQSEIWDRYRVGRRAHPFDVCAEERGPDLAYVSGAHTGYHRLAGRVTHRRWMCWVDRRFWLVCDSITGQGSHEVESLIHFHPDTIVVRAPDGSDSRPAGEVRNGSSTLQVLPWGEQSVISYEGAEDPLQGWTSAEFGDERRNVVWGLRCRGELPLWFGYVLWPDTAPVTLEADLSDPHACRVHVSTGRRSHSVSFGEGASTPDRAPTLTRR